MNSKQIDRRLRELHALKEGWMWGEGSAPNFSLSAAYALCCMVAVSELSIRKDGALVISAKGKREIIEIIFVGSDPIKISKKTVL